MTDSHEVGQHRVPDVPESSLLGLSAETDNDIEEQRLREQLAAKHSSEIVRSLLMVSIDGLEIDYKRTLPFIYWALGSYLALPGGRKAETERLFEGVWRYAQGERTNSVAHALGQQPWALVKNRHRFKNRLHRNGFAPEYLRAVFARFLDDDDRTEFIERLRLLDDVPEQEPWAT